MTHDYKRFGPGRRGGGESGGGGEKKKKKKKKNFQKRSTGP